jgi:hypothetical protein
VTAPDKNSLSLRTTTAGAYKDLAADLCVEFRQQEACRWIVLLTGTHISRRLADLVHPATVSHRAVRETELPGSDPQFHGDHDHLADHASELRRMAPDGVLAM